MKFSRYIIIVALAMAVSCTGKFEEMNTNPGAVSEVSPAYVLPSLQESTMHLSATYGYQTTENYMLQNYCQYYANTNAGLALDRYGYDDTYALDFWNPYYKALKHLKVLKEDLQEHPEYTNIYQMVRIVVAHATIGMTDTFGDLPYFEAALADNQPAYDSQKDIYYDVFKELTEASETLAQNLDGQSACNEDTDLFFAGDIEKWRKFANSLRLRCALRIVYVDPDKAKSEGEAAMAAGVMESNDDRCYIRVMATRWGHPLYQVSNWGEFRMSKTMENVLKHTSTVDDPRMELWFGMTANYMAKNYNNEDILYKGEKFSGVPNGQTSVSLGEEDADGWIANSIQNNSNIYGLIAFPDWNQGKSTPSATCPVPVKKNMKVMGYPEVCLLKAEAALRGWQGAGNAKDNYMEGIRASFEDERSFVDDRSLCNTANDELYLTTGDVVWDDAATDLNVNLKKIATQKWLAVYPYSFEAWAECRRTGFPELMPVYQSDDPDINPANNEFIRKIRYSDAERRDNAEHSLDPSLNGGKGDGMAVRVWWDTDDNRSISD